MNKIIIYVFLILVITPSCQRPVSLISNKDRLIDIDRMIKVQKELTRKSKKDIWSIFDRKLSQDERQALSFLFAYMSVSDFADYSSDFMLENVKCSLHAKNDYKWGSKIPEDIFLHFVLPIRVNNENLDSFRIKMYQDIKARVHNLTMKEAALEINHWCHEKVNYQGTDIRTSSPLSTIRKTFGRCGEESTLVVSAMRTAGIPARQVYTPRWAHTDDNHAWVEVWIDGNWHYLGACEPEPELDMGWFTEASKRAMLIHTRVYGRYFGKEDVITANDRFTEINLTARYAPVKDIFVKVLNSDHKPVDSAAVEFKLYNYAEFYTLATILTNRKGIARFQTGMGDLLIWVSKHGKYAFQKFSVSKNDSLTLVLRESQPKSGVINFDIVPPNYMKVSQILSNKAIARNVKMLLKEDSIRYCRIATFKDSIWTSKFSIKIHLPFDSLWPVIHKSYGNWPEYAAFGKECFKL